MTGQGVEEAAALLGTWLGLGRIDSEVNSESTMIHKERGKEGKGREVASEIKNPRLKGNKTGGKLP
jgi:GTP-binding protein